MARRAADGHREGPVSFAVIALWVSGAGVVCLALTAAAVALLPLTSVGIALVALAGVVLTIVAMGVTSHRVTARAIRAEFGDPDPDLARDVDGTAPAADDARHTAETRERRRRSDGLG